MSLEQRVSRLEDRRVSSPVLVSVEDRINAATASVADYADFYVDEIVQLQDEFLAQAPFNVALINSPFRHRLTHDTAVAYPPDRPLPPETQSHFDELVALFELRRGRRDCAKDGIGSAHRVSTGLWWPNRAPGRRLVVGLRWLGRLGSSPPNLGSRGRPVGAYPRGVARPLGDEGACAR